MLIPNEAFRALADPTRREILRLLRERPRTSGEIADHFPTAWATISRHLGVLKAADLIVAERNGNSVTYELNSTVMHELVAHMMDWTGMEWWLDETGKFNWGMNGKLYPYPLSDAGDVIDAERSGTIREMAVAVTATNDLGMELTVTNMDDPAGILWPRRVRV